MTYDRAGKFIAPRQWHKMARDEQTRLYDQHNPGARMSSDQSLRLYGTCGCPMCGEYRATYALNVPINRHGRRGSNSMAGINICDRCPAMVSGAALGEVQIITSGDHATLETIKRELCPVCVGEIVAVIEAKVERQQTAHKKAWQRPTIDPDEADAMTGVSDEALAAELFTRTMRQARAAIEAKTDEA